MSNYCYYGRIQVDSESFRKTNGVHIYMVKQVIEKDKSDKKAEQVMFKKIMDTTKEIKSLQKIYLSDLKKLQKEVKTLTARLDKLSPPKVKTTKSTE